jgi:magnesium transporter
VRLLAYDEATIEEVEWTDAPALARLRGRGAVVWVRVQGLGDRDLLTALAEQVGMHPLALEDAVHTHQRPKVEPYGEDLFVVARANDPTALARTEQIALFVRDGLCVSFEETSTSLFDPVRDRLLRGLGKIRQRRADYLAYALLDAAVDSYFPALEDASDRLDELEHETMARPTEALMARIYELKRDLSVLRRVVWPHREMLNRIARGEFDLVDPSTCLFFRDCQDHASQVLDQLDQLRDVGNGLMELHVSLVGNRMNEVMRLLTVIATIFIPLTFVVGVYGMNFDTGSPWNMPELGWTYGYLGVWAAMLAIVGGLLFWFRRQGWLGRP